MSETAQVQSDKTVEQSSQQQEEQQQKTEFTAEQLQARLKEVNAEAKKYRQSVAEEKRKREELEKKMLEEQGNWKQLAEQYKAEAETYKSTSSKLKNAFLTKTKSDQLVAEANKLGCVDSEVLLGIVDMEAVSIDDQFKVDQSAVKSVLEQVKASKPYLFATKVTKVHDLNPSTKDVPIKQKKLDELSSDEIIALMKSVQN